MKKEPFIIGENTVQPGQRKIIDLPMADLYTHTGMNLTAHVLNGRRPGPRLFVSAAVHGDEINGVEIIRRLLKRKILNTLRGTLIAIPIVNSFGLIHQSRYLPDRRDLNRMFPGSSSGSLAARLADIFMTGIVSQCTHGIDLHTGSNHRFNLPHIRASFADEETRELAEAFGAPVMVDAKTRDGSLRQAVAEKGVPVLLYEAGEALRFDEFSIRTGVRGIISVMHSIGMLSSKAKRAKQTVLHTSTSKWVRAPISGIVSQRVSIGAQVSEGEQIGIVSDPHNEVEQKIFAPVSGIILGRLELPLVYQGDALFHIAVFEEDQEAEKLIEELASELSQDDFRPSNSSA